MSEWIDDTMVLVNDTLVNKIVHSLVIIFS